MYSFHTIISKMFPQSVLFVVLLLCSLMCKGWSASSSKHVEPQIGCIEEERRALLSIKHNLHGIRSYADHDLLSSWGNEDEKSDCCKWLGIRCANQSGHVVGLDLSPPALGITEFDTLPALGGKISPSLFELPHLNYLDLSCIFFNGSQIPSSLVTLSQLRYLNLSYAALSVEIPPQLANLSRLEDLDLGYNYYGLTAKNLEWVSHLSSLRILDLSYLNLSRATDWAQRVNQLPSLTTLRLHSCSLPDINYSLSFSFVNSSTSLLFLDISRNDLTSHIFPWVFNFSNSLAYLDLSFNRLQGSIPEAFKSINSLAYLDLSTNSLQGCIPEAFSNMTSLKNLDVRSNMLNGSIPEVFSKMNSMTHLDLGYNELHGSIPKGFGNMTVLDSLDLSFNKLHGFIPGDFNKMTALRYLVLSYNELNGSIPNIFGNMTFLQGLYLENNTLEGELPRSIWNLSSLIKLTASSNNLSGHLPEVMSQLKQLETFDVSRNVLQGEISQAHFSNLSKLTILGLSSNLLSLKFHTNWTPPFQLDSILLGSCFLGPQFPIWLRSQKHYSLLDISNSGISDSIPNWFWDVSPRMGYMIDLSDNRISGGIGNNISLPYQHISEIDLSSNQLEGPIPSFMFQVRQLNLFQNRFSKLNLICNITSDMPLGFLDISSNELSEELPDCWSHFSNELKILILTNNKLSGRIPPSIGSLNNILSLKLNKNKFVGEILVNLKNCTRLGAIDFGENNLSETIPTWFGKRFSKLAILSLRSNRFHGGMPNSLCHLSKLQVLDLSLNHITGSIPKCISSFTAMRIHIETSTTINLAPGMIDFSSRSASYLHKGYEEKVLLGWKGNVVEFRSILGLVKSIDLSSNELAGEIPREISKLSELVFLNLSRNNLSGNIPKEIGQMKSLDTLDLSRNHLVGHIPESLAQIDRLNTLNLSNNNLSGKIPTGTQLQSFPAAAYTGNAELCGAPLPKHCSDMDNTIPGDIADEESDELFNKGFYISMAIGFMIAFWGVCAALIFNKTFRYAYFMLLNDVGDWVYVTATIQKVKLLKMIK